MNISCHLVHAQQFEETRLRRTGMEAKEAKSYDGCPSKGSLPIQDKTRLNKRFSNHVSSKFHKDPD